jgi:glycosidase
MSFDFFDSGRSVRTRLCAIGLIALVLVGNEIIADDEVSKQTDGNPTVGESTPAVPTWAADAVFYQIFPERFRNGDRYNDPTRESLEFPALIPNSWRITPWTQQWYQRDAWEREIGDDFYKHGVFHRRYGGDLQGVIEKLDYLVELGINAIYFNPVFFARSLHKYDGNSFHHIDPHFGPDPAGDLRLIANETAEPKTWNWTAADRLFLELVQQAHAKKIRIIVDGVFNHTGRDFFAFKDIAQNEQQSPYLNWYTIERFDDTATTANEFKYRCWRGIKTLPELANTLDDSDLHAEPKKYVMDSTRRWMDPNGDGNPSDGIDGWRLDVASDVPNRFWRDWNQLVREVNPDAYTVAEIWEESSDYLSDCQFSAAMNYHGFAYPTKGFFIDGRLPAEAFADILSRRMTSHPKPVRHALQNLIDSHDTQRLASMIVNADCDGEYDRPDRFDYDFGDRASPRWFARYDLSRPTPKQQQLQRLVSLFQMTFVGAPMIYYGTEAGMDGGDDPDDRMPMVWKDLAYQSRTVGPIEKLAIDQPIQFDDSLFEYYHALIRLRRENIALRHGDFQICAALDEAKLIAFQRSLPGQTLFISINRGDSECRMAIDAESFPGEYRFLTPVFSADDLLSSIPRIELDRSTQRQIDVVLPALSAIVWRADAK